MSDIYHAKLIYIFTVEGAYTGVPFTVNLYSDGKNQENGMQNMYAIHHKSKNEIYWGDGGRFWGFEKDAIQQARNAIQMRGLKILSEQESSGQDSYFKLAANRHYTEGERILVKAVINEQFIDPIEVEVVYAEVWPLLVRANQYLSTGAMDEEEYYVWQQEYDNREIEFDITRFSRENLGRVWEDYIVTHEKENYFKISTEKRMYEGLEDLGMLPYSEVRAGDGIGRVLTDNVPTPAFIVDYVNQRSEFPEKVELILCPIPIPGSYIPTRAVRLLKAQTVVWRKPDLQAQYFKQSIERFQSGSRVRLNEAYHGKYVSSSDGTVIGYIPERSGPDRCVVLFDEEPGESPGDFADRDWIELKEKFNLQDSDKRKVDVVLNRALELIPSGQYFKQSAVPTEYFELCAGIDLKVGDIVALSFDKHVANSLAEVTSIEQLDPETQYNDFVCTMRNLQTFEESTRNYETDSVFYVLRKTESQSYFKQSNEQFQSGDRIQIARTDMFSRLNGLTGKFIGYIAPTNRSAVIRYDQPCPYVRVIDAIWNRIQNDFNVTDADRDFIDIVGVDILRKAKTKPEIAYFKQSDEKYACAIFFLPDDIKDTITEWSKTNIPDEILAEDGRDEDSHITICYGLKDGDKKLLKDKLEFEPFEINLGKISIFEQKEKGYDVVKIGVESKELTALHKEISKLTDADLTHKFEGHITVAYVKPGEGKKFVGKRIAKLPNKIKVDKLQFSTEQRKITKLAQPDWDEVKARDVNVGDRLIGVYSGTVTKTEPFASNQTRVTVERNGEQETFRFLNYEYLIRYRPTAEEKYFKLASQTKLVKTKDLQPGDVIVESTRELEERSTVQYIRPSDRDGYYLVLLNTGAYRHAGQNYTFDVAVDGQDEYFKLSAKYPEVEDETGYDEIYVHQVKVGDILVAVEPDDALKVIRADKQEDGHIEFELRYIHSGETLTYTLSPGEWACRVKLEFLGVTYFKLSECSVV